MRHILVVANRTLAGDHLMELLQERVSSGPCRIRVLVPASPDPKQWMQAEADARAVAHERLQAALERIGDLGVEVTGEVGDELVLDAIIDVLIRESVDEIIVSTLPPGVSRWLGMDVVSRVKRAVDMPVSHVVAQEAELGSS